MERYQGNLTRNELRRRLADQPDTVGEELLEFSKGVCKIVIPIREDPFDTYHGTGFHLGNKFIMTAFHNMVDRATLEFKVHQAKFYFPEVDYTQAQRRGFLCTEFPAPRMLVPNSPRKDLAIIHVPEVATDAVPALHSIDYQPPNVRDNGPICLIHYGDDNSLQFSFGRITNELAHRGDEEGLENWYYSHNALGPPGSSGGPLVRYDARRGKLSICGVHHASAEPNYVNGEALLFQGEHWIQSTVSLAGEVGLPENRGQLMARLARTPGMDPDAADDATLSALDDAARRNRVQLYMKEQPEPGVAAMNLRNVHFLP